MLQLQHGWGSGRSAAMNALAVITWALVLAKNGKLEVWGVGQKVAAVLILVLQAFVLWAYQQLKHYGGTG